MDPDIRASVEQEFLSIWSGLVADISSVLFKLQQYGAPSSIDQKTPEGAQYVGISLRPPLESISDANGKQISTDSFIRVNGRIEFRSERFHRSHLHNMTRTSRSKNSYPPPRFVDYLKF